MRFSFILIASFVLTTTAFCQKKSADKILSEAYQQAAKENKKVFIIFHASWCGWCKKLDASMNDATCKALFNNHYITVHLTVKESDGKKHLETPGADVYLKKYMGDEAGLPFFVVVNEQGATLGDSYARNKGEKLDQPGENIGCPAKAEEVDAFIATLKKTSTLTDKQLKTIATRFRKNEQ
ncbi:MAG: thioredoxin family protein [Ferruginibacter sp.]